MDPSLRHGPLADPGRRHAGSGRLRRAGPTATAEKTRSEIPVGPPGADRRNRSAQSVLGRFFLSRRRPGRPPVPTLTGRPCAPVRAGSGRTGPVPRDPAVGDPALNGIEPALNDPAWGDPGPNDPAWGDPGPNDPASGDPGPNDPGRDDLAGGDPGPGGLGRTGRPGACPRSRQPTHARNRAPSLVRRGPHPNAAVPTGSCYVLHRTIVRSVHQRPRADRPRAVPNSSVVPTVRGILTDRGGRTDRAVPIPTLRPSGCPHRGYPRRGCLHPNVRCPRHDHQNGRSGRVPSDQADHDPVVVRPVVPTPQAHPNPARCCSPPTHP